MSWYYRWTLWWGWFLHNFCPKCGSCNYDVHIYSTNRCGRCGYEGD